MIDDAGYEDMHFLIADYAATGEGATVAILITRLFPRRRDWAREPSYVPGQGYDEGELCTPEEDILTREFAETFSAWMAKGMRRVSRAEMLEMAGDHLPPSVRKVLEGYAPPSFRYFAEFHINRS